MQHPGVAVCAVLKMSTTHRQHGVKVLLEYRDRVAAPARALRLPGPKWLGRAVLV